MAKGKDGKPKRPMSAYMFFAKDERPKVLKTNPNMGITEVAKVMGQRWATLAPAQKQKYQKLADKDKERYHAEGGGQKKEREGPKRPLSGYMFFVQRERPGLIKKNPSLSVPEAGKKLGEMWRKLNDNGRKPFMDMAEKDKARFARESAAWEKKKGKK